MPTTPCLGPLTGGPQCRMSILRNGHVPCHYFYNFHVEFEMVPCHMSILRNTHVVSSIFVLVSLCSMSHVNFKKWTCRPVEFRGQEPYAWAESQPNLHAERRRCIVSTLYQQAFAHSTRSARYSGICLRRALGLEWP